ncbi:carboxypeptidase M32 [Candidatus Wolfebacteria bacterium]|nr:carboxypeptidase M32 [Candidatus Wolfebacteria bacterium]
MAKQSKKDSLIEFKEKLKELAHLKSAFSVLHWDKEVYMPAQGNKPRAETLAYLSGELHQKFLSSKFKKLLEASKDRMAKGELTPEESAIVREVRREFERESKMPLEFVKELTRVTAEAHWVWAEARKKSDFRIFLPYLKKIVELKRKEAEFAGFKNSPYDALLDVYEPCATAEEISVILEELKQFLVPFLKKIQTSSRQINPQILKGNFSIEKQKEFGKLVLEKMGFSFEAGRLDTSTHPFTIAHHPYDVRITSRYDKNNLFYSLSSTIHEAGHALYEQGLLAENFGTPLGESVSLGVHESQSRVWENIVAKNKPFWRYFYPILQQKFKEPFQKISIDDFYPALNSVQPGFIRTEADEITYNLHIILRFEIEKALIEGTIAVENLPLIWNEKVKELLGLEAPNDAMGVLQDVHWSGGGIGYFPTYTLGNLYSAQFYETAKRDVLNLEDEIAAGEFGHFRNWLRKKIHIHGKFYRASDLVYNITGEKLNSRYFIEYLKKKYGEIYEL